MFLRVEPAILETFPGVGIGVVVAHGLDNRRASGEVRSLLRQAEGEARRALEGAAIAEHPRIAPWRDAYRRFGARPKKHLSSIESLARRVSKAERLREINKLVDLYNAVSLRHLLPVGGEDLARVVGGIGLTFAGDSEPAVRLLGDAEARRPSVGEVIYKDDHGAICRRWNWKEAERTKLTPETTQALLVIEALPPATRAELESAVDELERRVAQLCGGVTRTQILDEQRLEADLSSR
jgi:DNA/RNA-binding domain of Phe-tRNA-synthetase-like protein